MNKTCPRRCCEHCEHYVRLCDAGGLCGLKIEYFRWLKIEDQLAWVSSSGRCHQYRKAKQLGLPL